MRSVIAGRAVFDATVLVRSALGASERAREWTEATETQALDAVAPDLIWLETGNALAGYVRRGRLRLDQGRRALATLLRLPLRTIPAAELVEASFALALERRLSVYDACYAAIAEAEKAVLVTADRALAEAVAGSELIA